MNKNSGARGGTMSQQEHHTIIFPMLFEFKNGDGIIATLKYSGTKQPCFNPLCTNQTLVSVQLDLSSLDTTCHKGIMFYPICGNCLYKNITILSKYC
jgi:hypothetical protein